MKTTILAVALLALGCDDPLKPAQRIEEMRVLAARVEVVGAPDRASPAVGERATVRWLVAHPAANAVHGWSLAACASAATTKGVPECGGPIFATSLSPAPSGAEPTIELVAPDVSRVLVLGAICDDQTPELAFPLEDTRCGGDRSLVALGVDVGSDNLNPSIGATALELDGADWPAPAALPSGCDGGAPTDELPVVSANGAEHRVRFTLDEAARADSSGGVEPLLVSHYATSGLFERVYSAIERDQPPRTELGWEAPESIPDPTVVRLFFVVRDPHGGVDWTVRTLCVVP